MKFNPTLLAIAAATLLAGCGDAPQAPAEKRIVILGFDGMDPAIAQRFMDEGKLPNFSKLANEGHFQPLGTSNPPQSPVAWSDFAIGKHAGEHGIYDFLRRDPETYAPDFSISQNIAPETMELFGYHIPVGDGQVLNRRQGKPFWMTAEESGNRASVLRVPVTYPPDNIHRMLSGMGVPDLLGTQGTYTLYTTQPVRGSGSSSSTRIERVRPRRGGIIETTLVGPQHPLDPEAGTMDVPMEIRPLEGSEGGASITLGETSVDIEPGGWSDWVKVDFDFLGPLMGIRGMVRLHLVAGYPRIRLYVSPIHIDPMQPAVLMSSPPEYVQQLAERIGNFHTIGMPEETWSLNEEHISDQAYLDVIKTILAEREAMWYDTLDQNDSELVIGVFVQTDRVAHMFYRGFDPLHPLYPETDETARGAIEWIYKEADRVLGETLDRLGPDDQLMVISDHGFSPFRKAVNLNRWLVDNGYLVLKDGKDTSGVIFSDVDWSQSTAYALGLNGLFINRAGRESQGIVTEQQAAEIKAALMRDLPTAVDPETGVPLIGEMFDGDVLYPGNANGDAPDLVVGYEPGYRASWQTTLGAAPTALVELNDKKWSGDHCIAPSKVPGVLFTNFELEAGEIDALENIASYVLERL